MDIRVCMYIYVCVYVIGLPHPPQTPTVPRGAFTSENGGPRVGLEGGVVNFENIIDTYSWFSRKEGTFLVVLILE